ncbi:hypothetical protein D9623_00380 [Azospirillum brasilense]|uniref:NurA domain-containing protein n=1 Tax=Azospirillum brasilense TaxID=192 RepID=A0A0P0E7T8_AZOBR|nr:MULTISPECIES: hypothetical protein [Azospirillum]ALJ34258.1 hypothetical protein AMK58_01830 [Azospirillum brasilense]MDW7552753.1 hypothetical protein [Azospirillum brasilense]MDW7592055.1 hypothetical protein [Azospirillum brasilense]MDW7627668.1 hypothetical protein [Azospirillum brasilense]MDX5952863.1 hypothetical protein [Azospirillum brasilense]
MKTANRSLAQTLAVQSQVRLPGTVGRLLKQIRDLERVAPLFVKAGLVRAIDRPNPINTRVSGIATHSATARTIGGFLYGAVAARCDLLVEHNAMSTAGQDSACEIDDINYENQSKRLALVAMRQAYELAERAVSEERARLIFLDTPLVMDRGMVPPVNRTGDEGYQAAYAATLDAIETFWSRHRERLFPWQAGGPIIVGLASQRFGAIVQSAQQDLRSPEGRSQLLPTEEFDHSHLAALDGVRDAILGVGERRFVHGILGSFTRTAAFRMNVHAPRMEPGSVVDLGVIGLHFRAGQTTEPRLMQLVGDAPTWTAKAIDEVVGMTMALTAVGGALTAPLPVQLAERELNALGPFLENYSRSVVGELKRRELESIWLSDWDLAT